MGHKIRILLIDDHDLFRESLSRLLEAEPDNLRVQARLADLQLSTGQQKEAVETLHNAMQQVLDRGDYAEANRLGDRDDRREVLVERARSIPGPQPPSRQSPSLLRRD